MDTFSGYPKRCPSPSLICSPRGQHGQRRKGGSRPPALPSRFRRGGGVAAGLRLQQVDPLQEGADRDYGGGAAAEGADEAGLDGSGGDGGEELGKPRWGGAPTMARPAGNGGGATWWRSVEAGAKRGGPAAARPGGGSRRAAPESTGGAVTRPNLAAPMAQRPGAPHASSAARAQGSDSAGGERASTGPRARGESAWKGRRGSRRDRITTGGRSFCCA